MELEKTLVLIKPDGVQRGIMGQVIDRFEKVGLKIIGMKLIQADEEMAKKHYTEDITERRGEKVRQYLVDFVTSAPVLAICIEGVESIEIVRKMVGSTQPKEAVPGTIRGDFTHVSYKYADEKEMVVRNVIHASADEKDAKYEVSLWFSKEELCEYERDSDKNVL